MVTHGVETPTELKTAPLPSVSSKNPRVLAEGAEASNTRMSTSRRRRDSEKSFKPNLEERFFLAEGEARGKLPALGKECPTEAEAIIEAFRAKVNFYRLTEFQTRADIGASGEPILKKEALKKANPAS